MIEPPPPPLSIYVVFHPASEECRALADQLHDWFRLKHDDGDGTEAGLPIWYRAALHQGRVSPPIEWSEAENNAVVVLVSDDMVADRAWRVAIEALCEADGGLEDGAAAPRRRVTVFPVAVDASAYRLGFLFGPRNRLPAGASADGREAETREARQARLAERARVLRRGLTEAVTRMLRQVPDAAAPPALSVFVSHAKADGTPVASAIRDGLASFGQLKAWYDENDLPPGSAWRAPIEEAASKACAALISVVTDAYPTRHWCRREVIVARTPRPLPIADGPATASTWTTQPTVAVSQTRRWSRCMAQLAQVPQLGWGDAAGPSVRARVEDIVDRLLLETLLVTFYRRYAPALAKAHAPPEASRHLALMTWVPDPWTLTQLVRELRGTAPAATWTIAYPGHGLRTSVVAELEDILAAVRPEGAADIELISQERLGAPTITAPSGKKVAVSGGGVDADVYGAGVGIRHVDDTMVRLTRRLLESGARVLYGGTIGTAGHTLTDALIEAARGWDSATAQSADTPASSDLLDRPPLVNYVAWPRHRAIDLRRRAELTGICAFVDVVPEGAPAAAIENGPEAARVAAAALSLMRQQVSRASDLRAVFAGKVTGWDGWMPGIMEEVASSLAAQKLPLVMGGWGGCAGLIARYLASPTAPWPEALARASFGTQEKFALLMQASGAQEEASRRWEEAQALVAQYRAHLHGTEPWAYAWTRAGALAMLRVGSASVAVNGVLEALGMTESPPAR